MRRGVAAYHCKYPPNEGKYLDRIQFFYVQSMVNGWNRTVLDYPEVLPRCIVNWFCTNELVEAFNAGRCPLCNKTLTEVHNFSMKASPAGQAAHQAPAHQS